MNDSIPQVGAPVKHCDQCGRDLPETSEFWHRRGDKFRLPCKSCRHGEYVDHSKEIIDKQREAYLALSPEEQKEFRARQNKNRRELYDRKAQAGMCKGCLARPAAPGRTVCDHCYEYEKHLGDQLRDQVFAAYGGKCVVCGESHPAFLAVDHIDDSGADHRRTVGGGHRLYRWLCKNGFPTGFQLLCHNHNWLKRLQLQPVEKTYIMLWHAKLRQEMLVAYGGICSCCGEDRPEVLTIDHVNNDGADHRREVGKGSPFYAWLRKNGFPKEGFQLLCFNCNRARFYYGACPHQQ